MMMWFRDPIVLSVGVGVGLRDIAEWVRYGLLYITQGNLPTNQGNPHIRWRIRLVKSAQLALRRELALTGNRYT